ncbi:MAG TPA: glycoside hydrolase family 3 C-terminal domain-containing protein, partial [Actinocrinis sp.]|uniref:glycoside hydrolase family 3 C-terminal domain-containing protein n=1 Tax=Actinocrinis sp. TaxID=1920516 RepID=UPI002DDD5D21
MRTPTFVRAALAAALVAGFVSTLTPAHAASPPWMDATQPPATRAQELLAQMTSDEKIAMMHGGSSCNGYGACVDANTRLGIPQLRLQDGPAGVADGVTGVTELPAPVAGAATWDTSLMQQYGQVIGAETWAKGANVSLGPTINIVRDPRWGRAFESYSEDPYLNGQLAAADIQGIQSQGPIDQVKHYAVYNQETYRNSSSDNAQISARTEQEIYLPAFQAAVQQGGAESVMCSYAMVNGTFACENPNLLQTILRNQLGFTGFVTSDWGGTHSTVASADNGLDMEMNGSTYYGSALTSALSAGQVTQATIDGHVLNILTAMFAAGLFDKTNSGSLSNTVTSAADTAVARQVAEEGSVLLKNSGAVLPVTSADKSIAVIGDDAGVDAETAGNGSAHVNAPYVTTPYQGISSRAGSGATVTYSQGVANPNGSLLDSSYLTPSSGTGPGLYGQYYSGNALSGSPVFTRVDPVVNFNWGGNSPGGTLGGTNWSAKWTGTLTPPTTGTYNFSLTSDDGSRLYINGQQVINNWADQPPTTKTGSIALTAGQPVSIEVDYFQDGGGSQVNLDWQIPNQDLTTPAVNAAKAANLAVVFVNNAEGEGADLNNIDLSAAQNQLISSVAAAQPNTVVVVNSGSAVTMPWAGSVKGIIENWYPGQEDGTAVAALLWGDVNFSGKLPVTFPQSLTDVPANTAAQWPGQNGTVQYSEGLDVGYRWYDAQSKTPMFPFGFGLSYTTFGYANLTVGAPDANGNVAVGFDVTNTGSVAGTEIAQVYVGQPSSVGEPPKNLRGFQRVTLTPGQTQHVALTLDARSFQYWNNTGWSNAAGANQVYVGASSRDVRLTGQVTIPSGGTGSASLSASPNSLAFAAQNVGSTSAAQSVTITNGGNAAASITSVAASGDYAETNTCGSSLAAGASCSASVTFTPTAAGTRTGALTVNSNAANSPLTVNLSGTGNPTSTTNLALTATMSASGSQSGFPPSNANDGNTSSYWESTNNAFPQWLQADLGSSQSLGSVTLTLPPSTSWATRTQTLSVLGSTDGANFTTLVGSAGYTFNPSTGNTVTIPLPASTSDRYLRLNFTANTGWPAGQISEFEIFPGSGGGTNPAISTSVASLSYGNQTVGTTSSAQGVTVSNTGNAAATISSITTSGPYTQTNNCGSTLAAGASCTVN